MLAPNIKPEAKQQDDLAKLAKTIRNADQAVGVAMRNALRLALDAGDALIEAQGLVPAGHWERWLRDSCFLRARTAQLYQQLARHRQDIEAKIERVPDLSLRAARQLVAKPRAKAEAAEPTVTEASITATPSPTLLEVWNAASDEARRAFLEQVGVPGLLSVLSDSMKSDLAKRSFGAAASSSALSEKEKRKLKSIGRKVSTQRLREIPPEGNA